MLPWLHMPESFFSLGFKNSYSPVLSPHYNCELLQTLIQHNKLECDTNHSCLQIQDKIKHLEEKLCKEEHQHKLLQDKTAQVDLKDFILSYFLVLKKALCSKYPSSFITF